MGKGSAPLVSAILAHYMQSVFICQKVCLYVIESLLWPSSLFMIHVGVVGKCKKFHSYVLVESVDLLSLNASAGQFL